MKKASIMSERLRQMAQSTQNHNLSVRGRGQMLALDCATGNVVERILRKAFNEGLVVERCGAEDQVIKFLPSLTIDAQTLQTLQRGLDILDLSVHASDSKSRKWDRGSMQESASNELPSKKRWRKVAETDATEWRTGSRRCLSPGGAAPLPARRPLLNVERRRHACPITSQFRRGERTYGSFVGRNAPLAILASNTGGIGEVTCTET